MIYKTLLSVYKTIVWVCGKNKLQLFSGYFYTMRFIYVIFIIVYLPFSVVGQEIDAQEVKGLPTEEVYDLLSDSKGFIWVAHSLGISRFNGHSFTSFHHPMETGAGVTDLIEDNQGRIWFHNFNGQIFYIENEKMHLLKEYKYEDESYFPRLTILGNELIASSENGLFICNTINLQCRYIYINTGNHKTKTLAKIGNTVYLSDGEIWFQYRLGKPIKRLTFRNISSDLYQFSNPSLQPLTTTDTIYSKDVGSLIYKFVIRNDTAELVAATHENDFINTITRNGNNIWINKKNESYTIDHNCIINNQNLTDIVTDREGNTWFSSLDKGLHIKPRLKQWYESQIMGTNEKNSIRCFIRFGSKKIYGTQKGDLLISDNGDANYSSLQSIELPFWSGPIESIYSISPNEILITPSIGLFLYNFSYKKLYELSNKNTVKSIALTKENLFLAYSRQLSKIPSIEILKKQNPDYENEFIPALIYNISNLQNLRNKRCYSVCYDSNENKLLASFKDGLFEFKNDEFKPVLFNHSIINASVLVNYKYKFYAGTFNNGLYIIGKNGIKNITIETGLISNVIFQLKLIGNELYILETDNIQVLDLNKEMITSTIPLPEKRNGLVYDIWKDHGNIHVASHKNLFSISTESFSSPIKPVCYILSVTANDSLLPLNKSSIKLAYKQNSLQFKLESPTFIYPALTIFRYRLMNEEDTSWKQVKGNENTLSFSSLKPGYYKFEAYAVNFQNNSGNIISYSFEIEKPFWLQWWFLSLEVFLLISFSFFLIRFYITSIKRKNQQTIEKLDLRNELRLSLLNTLKAQMNPHFVFNSLNTIQSFVYMDDKKSASKYMGKFSELVRHVLDNSNQNEISLSAEIDLLQLYLDLEKVRFENNLFILFEVSKELDTDQISLPPMLIQPFVENAIVHGLFHYKGTKQLKISIFPSEKEKYIEIVIDDNGIGRARSRELNKYRKNHTSFATSAIERRIELINQILHQPIIFEIKDKLNEHNEASGTTVKLMIPVKIY